MTTSNWLLVAFYAVSAIAIVVLVRLYLRRRRSGTIGSSRGSTETRHEATPNQAPAAGTVSAIPLEGDYWFGPLTPTLASLLPESPTRREQVERELRHAGFYQPHAWENLAALRYLGIVVPMIVCGVLLIAVPPRWEGMLLALLVLLPAAGWALPRLYVRRRAAERLALIEHGMPDMLDMLNMCVSQGMTLQEALRRVAERLRHVNAALAKELRIVCQQAEVGTLTQALESFGRRIDVPEVHAFTTLLIQTERMGTSISEALAEYSDGMRESLRQRADEKANKAAFKLLFPTVLCLMPAVYLFLLGPAVLELSEFFAGGGGREAVEATQSMMRTINNR